MAVRAMKIAGCEIMPCKCAHAFQDKRYGPGKRVHNMCKSKSGGVSYRCTVCKNVREGTYQPIVEGDKDAETAKRK